MDKITWLSRKAILISGVTLNLLSLLIIKYSNFVLGLAGSSLKLDIIIPAGLSFYVFQSTTYIIDRYRNETGPEKNILKYALFVSFFPCLLSGPIERSKNFLCQTDVYDNKKFDPVRIKKGLMYMLWGYFFKLVIVPRMLILTDTIFGSYEEMAGSILVLGLFAYSFQIYCDFAGYSFIALGCAGILGYEVTNNFRQPYLARSIAEHWRRWHISLSTWFRDYMYIPLGGNRKGEFRKYINIMLVFLVSGLWHGADLTFLVWGGLHGGYQVIGYIRDNIFRKLGIKIKKPGDAGYGRLHDIFRIVITYLLVTSTWVPFLSANVKDMSGIYSAIVQRFDISSLTDGTVFSLGLGVDNLVFVIGAVVILIIVELACEKKQCDISGLFENVRFPLRWSFYYLLIIMIIFSLNLSSKEFLYQSF
ncbi:MAG: MBOAT family protein [Lachnospiraceae bacterium]|nr:MBOAT family protein [Lachnospiraceae bacterium]